MWPGLPVYHTIELVIIAIVVLIKFLAGSIYVFEGAI